MTVKVIGDVATFVSGVFTRPYTLRNAGANDVYLGQDSSLTVHSRALTLTRGATVQWDGSTELWAVCATGDTSELEWVYEAASSVTDGTQYTEISGDVNLAPGSTVGIDGTVTVGGSVDIAGGTIDISGPVAIAGDVSVDGSTINVGTPVDSKPITDVTALAVGSVAVNAIGGHVLTYAPAGMYDVSSYSSVLIDVYYDTNGVAPDNVGNFFSVVIEFYRDPNDIVNGIPPVWVANPQWLAADLTLGIVLRARGSVQVPVVAQYLNVRAFCTIGTLYAVGSAQSVIYGSSEVITKVRYSNSSNDAGYGLQQWAYQIKRNNVISDNTEFIASTNDPLYVQIYRNLTAAGVTYVLYGAINGALTDLWNLTLNAGAGVANYHEKFSPVFTPMIPLALRLRILTANSDAYIVVSQDR